ncbi:MAG: CCA tRNA nucleotidyltransferase [Rhodospirillaceae bacterium]
MDPAGRLDPQPWMTAPATLAVLAALTADGRPARFVGGCVRDAVAGRPVKDIDIATPEPPARAVDLLHAAGLRAVPTGIDHGTVTAVAPGGAHFEITTLRHDVETFGRHARVAFTDDWTADAARRDFTMNALYADADGTLYDPTGGLADLAAGRVRFVGSAEARIREDVLRLLRFYRFHAHYGRVPPDDDTVAACRALAPLVAGLSAERVWAEVARLMLAPDPAATLDLMAAHGVLPHVIPEAGSRDPLRRLVGLEATLPYPPDPIRRLAAFLDLDDAGARAVANRLRLSRKEATRLRLIVRHWPEVTPALDPPAARKMIYAHGNDAYADLVLVAWARASDPDAAWRPLWKLVTWPAPAFPLKGRDAVAAGVPNGPTVGKLMKDVEAWWIAGDFTADRAACLMELESRRQGA